MTDISIVRGDSKNFSVTITESDGTTPIDITEGVVRMAVKASVYDDNADAIIFKQSYYTSQIEKTAPASGQCVVKILIGDTNDVNPGGYYWDIDLTRKGELVTSAGTFAVTAGSGVLTGTAVDFSLLSVGQLIDLNGGFAANNVLVDIVSIDASAGTVTVGYDGFVDESGITHSTFQGDRKTPTGLSGGFSIGADVVE